ncbi:MAG: 4-hydroxythreonine-4-phosphate dehydrogenase PdxA [Spirochaetales bacterium]|nr:MAG: 4-hydroxythreonine-4-phosphate dehydrogenase PdxA [Spirochaetales bacterium]
MMLIAVTMGDPAGIGPEIVLKASVMPAIIESKIPFFVIGDVEVLKHLRDKFQVKVKIAPIAEPREAKHASPGVLYVLDQEMIKDLSILVPGKVSSLAGKCAGSYIARAVNLNLSGDIQALVTGPINKEAIHAAGIPFKGHTEMLADLSGAAQSMTMFQVDKLRIFFHTRHVSLKDALRLVSAKEITKSIQMAHQCMQSIGQRKPVLALAAFNPHASDGGLFGDEEALILEPALKAARALGIDVKGPVPADSVFHQGLEGIYDGIVSLYHDQGHIAAKTYDFYRTVSVTFGLPYIRTSVDHGTAFDIAWKGKANPLSMVEAILACGKLAGKYKPF